MCFCREKEAPNGLSGVLPVQIPNLSVLQSNVAPDASSASVNLHQVLLQ